MEVLVPFYAVFLAARISRFVGASGLRRFEALADDQARQVHSALTSRFRWGMVAYFGFFGIAQLWLAIDARSPLRLASAAITFVALALTVCSVRRALPGIEAAYAERDLPPLESAFVARDRSARRSRRMGQLLRITLVASMLAVGLSVLAGLVEARWVTVLLVVAWSVVGVTLVALGWATAWLYGDEQPAGSVGDPATRPGRS